MGAYAAHGLVADEPTLEWVETAARYQIWHAVALLAVTALMRRDPERGMALLHAAAAGFLAGTLLFSGSLYLLALTGWHGFAAVTPFGGVALLLGWAALAGYGLMLRRDG